jgi:hypothetical protein
VRYRVPCRLCRAPPAIRHAKYNAPQSGVDALVASASKYSAVFDMLSNPTDVAINVSR